MSCAQPLNMIIGFSQLIVNAPQTYGTRLPAALMADLNVILRNSEHLLSLVDDVLDLSQIEAGQMAITKERVDPREIVSAATTAVYTALRNQRALSAYFHARRFTAALV